jgi:hypothetical protein
MGPTFKHLMRLFGLTDLKIKDISSEQPLSSSILDAFSSVGFQTMRNVAQSMFDLMFSEHKKEYPDFMQISKPDRRSAFDSIRNKVRTYLLDKFLRLGLGLTVDLSDLPVINSFVVFDIVKKSMSFFDLPFFKKLFQVINDGLYANSFHSMQARKARFSANKRFLESQSGEAVNPMTFFDAIHEVQDKDEQDDSNDFKSIEEVKQAMIELFRGDKKFKEFDIISKLETFSPTIMACQRLTPLFPPPTEEKYIEFPKDHEGIISRVLGNTMSEDCGGIGLFNNLCTLSDEVRVNEYANLISLGQEDLDDNVFNSEFYARFLYLLEGLQYFSSIDVEEMVKEALAQREQSDK